MLADIASLLSHQFFAKQGVLELPVAVVGQGDLESVEVIEVQIDGLGLAVVEQLHHLLAAMIQRSLEQRLRLEPKPLLHKPAEPKVHEHIPIELPAEADVFELDVVVDDLQGVHAQQVLAEVHAQPPEVEGLGVHQTAEFHADLEAVAVLEDVAAEQAGRLGAELQGAGYLEDADLLECAPHDVAVDFLVLGLEEALDGQLLAAAAVAVDGAVVAARVRLQVVHGAALARPSHPDAAEPEPPPAHLQLHELEVAGGLDQVDGEVADEGGLLGVVDVGRQLQQHAALDFSQLLYVPNIIIRHVLPQLLRLRLKLTVPLIPTFWLKYNRRIYLFFLFIFHLIIMPFQPQDKPKTASKQQKLLPKQCGQTTNSSLVRCQQSSRLQLIKDALESQRIEWIGAQLEAVPRRKVGLGREEGVDSEPQCLLDDRGNNLAHDRVGSAHLGIGVDASQINLQAVVQHEVQPDQLEVAPALRVHLLVAGQHQVDRDLLHLRNDLLLKRTRLVGIVGLQVTLKVVVGQLVGRLVTAVVWTCGLDAVGGEVDERVEVFEQEGLAAGAHVALVVPVDPERPADGPHQDEVVEVELPPLVEEGPLDVLLEQERPRLVAVLEHLPQLLHDLGRRQQLHFVLVVCAFPRLDEPQLLLVLQYGEGVEVDVCARGVADEVGLGVDVPGVAALRLLVVVLQHLEDVLALVEEVVAGDVVGDDQRGAGLRVDELVALLVDQLLHRRLIPLRNEQPIQVVLLLIRPLHRISHVFLAGHSLLLMLVDAAHVFLRPIQLTVLRLTHYLIPKSLLQYLLNQELVVARSHVDPDAWRIGDAEREVGGEASGELDLEVEVEEDLELGHVDFLVVAGIHAEGLLALQPLQRHVPGSLVRQVLRCARPPFS